VLRGVKVPRAAWLVLVAAVALAACGGEAEPREGSPRSNLMVEGARAYVLGELQRAYGRDADPHIVSLTSEVVAVEGTRAFRLEVTARFTRQGRQEIEGWTFWVGVGKDGEAGVLRSEGPRPVAEAER
jgi:hypothetical protein